MHSRQCRFRYSFDRHHHLTGNGPRDSTSVHYACLVHQPLQRKGSSDADGESGGGMISFRCALPKGDSTVLLNAIAMAEALHRSMRSRSMREAASHLADGLRLYCMQCTRRCHCLRRDDTGLCMHRKAISRSYYVRELFCRSHKEKFTKTAASLTTMGSSKSRQPKEGKRKETTCLLQSGASNLQSKHQNQLRPLKPEGLSRKRRHRCSTVNEKSHMTARAQVGENRRS